jgi:hypothetical protein
MYVGHNNKLKFGRIRVHKIGPRALPSMVSFSHDVCIRPFYGDMDGGIRMDKSCEKNNVTQTLFSIAVIRPVL